MRVVDAGRQGPNARGAMRFPGWGSLVLGRSPAARGLAVGLLLWVGAAPARADVVLQAGPYAFRLSDGGTLVSVERRRAAAPTRSPVGDPGPAFALNLGSFPVPMLAPRSVRESRDRWRFEYAFRSDPALTADLTVWTERRGRAVLLRRSLRLRSAGPVLADLGVKLIAWPTSFPSATWVPREDGVGASLGSAGAGVYHAAGRAPGVGVALALALPMLSFEGGVVSPRVTLYADPWFSARFAGQSITWEYPGVVGLEQGDESRQVDLVLHDGAPDAALDAFFAGALAGVPAGPDWLHRIRLVGYDYLSDGGEGWHRDIEALSAALSAEERKRVFLCLHGWYDHLGRYSFDAPAGRLDAEWVAFAGAAQVSQPVPKLNLDGDLVEVGFPNARPVAMSREKIHERLRYARRKGFRVGLYYADGLAAGAGLPGFAERKVLYWGGWRGPDSLGRTYCQNPLVPEVRDFYVRYLGALLEEFGHEIDGLVWDETFHVPQGSLGATNGVGPVGYADRAMMRLTDELRGQVDRFNARRHREVAFLVSDCAGMPLGWRAPPTALWAHGTYQDSHFRPTAWGYAIFPNYRNVAWSCCWWPVSKWGWVETGVRQFQAPIPVTNGWGDDVGFAEMTAEQRGRVVDLFRERGRSRDRGVARLRWLPEPRETLAP